MKTSLKWLAVLSAALVLTACETGPNAGGSGSGGGSGANGAGGMGTGGELAAGVGDRVFFDYDSSQIDSEGQKTLERQASWLQQNGNVNVTVEGHCDERGTREYNLALGERRASAAKKYLVSLGVKANRITTVSYGKERPAVVGSNDSSWAQNRRAVTVTAQ